MHTEEFIKNFNGVKKTGEKSYQAICPAHDDHKASLTITDAGDKTLIHCHAGCPSKKILNKVGLEEKDLFENTYTNTKLEAEYIYTDINYKPLYKVMKFTPKSFIQAKYDKGNWIYKMSNANYVLYNLPNVIKSEVIYFVEGEKDADNLNEIGLVATTTVGGASGFKKRASNYIKNLKDKIVYIVPDNDTPGYKYADNIKESLKGIAKEVKVLALKHEVKDLKEKQDISDVLQRFGKEETLNILDRLINKDYDNSIDISIQENNIISSLKNHQIAKIILEENYCKIYNNELYIYSKGFYIKDDKFIYKKILELKPDASAHTRKEIYKYLELYAEEKTINKESGIINFKNGLFDLKKRNIISTYA